MSKPLKQGKQIKKFFLRFDCSQFCSGFILIEKFQDFHLMDTISLIAMVRLISHDVLHTLTCPRRVGHNRFSLSNVYQSLTIESWRKRIHLPNRQTMTQMSVHVVSFLKQFILNLINFAQLDISR